MKARWGQPGPPSRWTRLLAFAVIAAAMALILLGVIALLSTYPGGAPSAS